jgi:uncharacterized protein (TIGR02246 family)
MGGEDTADQVSSASSAPAASPAAAVEAEIRSAAADFAAAFARADAAGLARHWTADGDYIDEFGQRYVGRAAIQAEYELFFQQNPGITMQITVDSVRPLGPDIAVEDGRAVLRSSAAGVPASSRYTAVHVRQDGQWLMASVRDMRVVTTSHSGHLAELGWLIGHWVAEHGNLQLDVNYRWIVADKVIERTHRVTEDGRVTSSGSQIIGWDPISQQIESWIFSTGGGYAVGVWSTHDIGWTVETVGVANDGTPTTAANTLVRVSDNTLSWTSTSRWIGDATLPNVDEVLLTRK